MTPEERVMRLVIAAQQRRGLDGQLSPDGSATQAEEFNQPHLGLYRFNFIATLVAILVAVPASYLAIIAATLMFRTWLLINAAHVNFPVTRWLVDNWIAFVQNFVCVAIALLAVFWALLWLRKKSNVRLSVSSVVMSVCAIHFCVGCIGLAYFSYEVWHAIEAGAMSCKLPTWHFYKCNFNVIGVSNLQSAFGVVSATVFSGHVYSKYLDDTAQWLRRLQERMEARFPP